MVDAGLWDAEATDDGLGDSVSGGLGEVRGGSSGLVEVGVSGDDFGTCTSESTDIRLIAAVWVLTAKGVKREYCVYVSACVCVCVWHVGHEN